MGSQSFSGSTGESSRRPRQGRKWGVHIRDKRRGGIPTGLLNVFWFLGR